jgi:phage gp29-like protein
VSCQIKVLFETSSHVTIHYPLYERKEADDMKSYEELARDQKMRESSFLSDVGELTDLEANLGQRRDEILFKITTELEDTKNALNQVEQLAQRLRKYLDRLKNIYQTLSK